MTDKEKAKAYDEALNKAQCWLNDPQTIQDRNYTIEDCLQNIFTELRESEDERLRKELIEQVQFIVPKQDECDENGKELPCYRERIAKYIAYLENLKEQKPIQPNIEREYIEERLRGLIDKEGEYYRGAREELAHLFYILGGQPSQYLINNVVKKEQKHMDEPFETWIDGWYNEHHRDGYITMDERGFKNFCRGIRNMYQQKPAEWDDYTKTNLGRAIQIIKNTKGNLQGYQTDDGIYECDKAIECLEHFLYRGLEIEKLAEWSKEDEMYLSQAIETLEHENYLILADKLKSLRPSWKPSEEDIDALKELIDDANKRGWVTPGASRLYEQLKAL